MTTGSTWLQRGKSITERFSEKVQKGDGCWLWQSALATNGYGLFWVGGKKRTDYAHRLAWEMANDQAIPAGHVVMHSCDTPRCVNPSHLSVGLPKDNKLDSVTKKRHAFGSRNGGGVKLNDATASEILALQGIKGSTTVSRQYGVSKYIVQRIWKRTLWKHI